MIKLYNVLEVNSLINDLNILKLPLLFYYKEYNDLYSYIIL